MKSPPKWFAQITVFIWIILPCNYVVFHPQSSWDPRSFCCHWIVMLDQHLQRTFHPTRARYLEYLSHLSIMWWIIPVLPFWLHRSPDKQKSNFFYLELWLIAWSLLNWLLTLGKAVLLRKKNVKTDHQQLPSALGTFYLQIKALCSLVFETSDVCVLVLHIFIKFLFICSALGLYRNWDILFVIHSPSQQTDWIRPKPTHFCKPTVLIPNCPNRYTAFIALFLHFSWN